MASGISHYSLHPGKKGGIYANLYIVQIDTEITIVYDIKKFTSFCFLCVNSIFHTLNCKVKISEMKNNLFEI